MKRRRVVVIGAGAAGMMAAGAAAEQGAQVAVFEKNERVGRKLAITGKGRCNLTNDCDIDTFIANVVSNPRFLYSAVNRFSCYDTIAFFESLGVSTKTERGNRVFPVSDKATDVVDALFDYVIANGGEILHREVKGLLIKDGSVTGVKLGDRDYAADRVIVTTGGSSYKATGSTGDGYRFARAAGHSVTPLLPSLVPLVSHDNVCAQLQGLALKNVRLRVINNNSNKEIYSDFGEMLFTHFGLSGPMVLSASAHMRDIAPGKYRVEIDLKPALDCETLDARLLKDFARFRNRDMINAMDELLPKSLIPAVLDRAGIAHHAKCNRLTSEGRRALLDVLKGFSVQVDGFRPINEAIVTAGGVNVKEIDPKTMESRLVKGLYFAGEVLDLDAYTGGFNLQIAFSTGRLAGENAAIN